MAAARSQEEWHRLFSEQAESGEAPAAFCARHGIRLVYFYTRRRELTGQQARSMPTASPSAFVPLVTTPHRGGDLTVTHREVTLQVSLPIAPEWVAALVMALQKAS